MPIVFLGLLMLASSMAEDIITKESGTCTAGSACIEDEMNYLQLSLNVQEKNCNAVKLVPLAQMARIVYELHANTQISSTAPEITSEGFSVAEQKQQPDFAVGRPFKPAYAVWKRDSPCKQAVLAIKGTDLGSLTDVTTDLQSIVGGVSPDEAKQYLGAVVDKYKGQGYTVLVTGHSLGGYMGEIMSTTKNIPGAVFDAPGPDGPISSHNGPNMNADFHNLNGEHEPIGNLAPGVFVHKQWSIYVVGLNSHGIQNMVDKLKQKAPDNTNVNIMDKVSEGKLGYYLNLLDGRNMSARLPGYYLE